MTRRSREVTRQPVEVDVGAQGLFVAPQPHVRHLGERHDLLDRLDHAETGPQDRHEQHDFTDPANRCATRHRRID